MQSLFDRLGGSEGLEKLANDILIAHMENPAIRTRFLALADAERFQRVKRHVVQFFAMGTGGPKTYEGRSMVDAHRGMNLNGDEFLAATDDVMMVLRKHGVDEQSQKDVLAIFYSLKGDVIRV